MAQNPPEIQPVSIYTWNSQGNFTAEGKSEEVAAMMAGPGLALAFIQEGGVDLEGKQDGYTVVSGISVGAFNERCTNYVLYNDGCPRRTHEVVMVTGRDDLLIGGGVAGRTPAAVAIDRVLFVCWHSLSAPSNLDTSFLIKTMRNDRLYAENYDLMILGGDFNATPGDIEALIERSGNKRSNFSARIVCSGRATLKKWDKDVDFFVIFRKEPALEPDAVLVKTVTSDHYAVRMDMLLPI